MPHCERIKRDFSGGGKKKKKVEVNPTQTDTTWFSLEKKDLAVFFVSLFGKIEDAVLKRLYRMKK